jgi:hypothetical protein
LTGKPARYNVNNSSPRLAVKGAYVIPDRERRENFVILSGAQYACGIGFPFDRTNGSPSEQFSPENASTSSGEEGEFA